HLHWGDRDTLAEAERREVDVGPALDGPDDARRFTGQLDARPVTEAEGAQVAVEALPAETLADLGRPDVARVLDHLGERQPPVWMRVVDRPPGRLEAAAFAEEELARRDDPLLDRRRGEDRLERGAGLIGIRDRPVADPVAPALVGPVAGLVRVVRRDVGQREHLARRGV